MAHTTDITWSERAMLGITIAKQNRGTHDCEPHMVRVDFDEWLERTGRVYDASPDMEREIDFTFGSRDTSTHAVEVDATCDESVTKIVSIDTVNAEIAIHAASVLAR